MMDRSHYVAPTLRLQRLCCHSRAVANIVSSAFQYHACKEGQHSQGDERKWKILNLRLHMRAPSAFSAVTVEHASSPLPPYFAGTNNPVNF